ncbi:hypothetical protein ACFL54_00020 [Planctomycetota bacterium]
MWPYETYSPNCFSFIVKDIISCSRTTIIITPTTVENFPNNDPAKRTTHASFFFEPHQWNHAVLAWDIKPADGKEAGTVDNENKRLLILNGRNPVQPGLSQTRQSLRQFSKWQCEFRTKPDYWIRFGSSGSEEVLNYVSDCSYDEIVIYEDQFVDTWIRRLYEETGRYYYPEFEDEIAEYLSPQWNLFNDMKLRGRQHLDILGVAWTAYWPKYNRRVDYEHNPDGTVIKEASVPPNVNDLDGPDPLKEIYSADSLWTEKYGIDGGWTEAFDPVSVDIARVDASDNVHWIADDKHDKSLTYAGGSRVAYRETNSPLRLLRGEELKFKIYFNQPAGEIAYEVPVLDDITFFVGTRKVLYWQVIH